MSEMKTILKDIQYYLWLSSLRDCWNESEKEHVNKLYGKIASLIEYQKKINEQIELNLDIQSHDIHDRDYIQAEQDMYKQMRDSEHLKFWLQNL
jgi:polysaccharide pyruvyl transferase WcaK-like protein